MDQNKEASKQTINITSSAAEKAIEIAKDFLQSLVMPSINEIGLLVSENIKLFRFKNQINLLNKAKAHCDKIGVSTKRIPLKILFPLLENASLEEDETLQDKWAALLANFASGKIDDNTGLFVSILNQLSEKEVKFLDSLWKESKGVKLRSVSKRKLSEIVKLEDFQEENLYRLNLIADEPVGLDNTTKLSVRDSVPVRIQNSSKIKLSSLGAKFVEVCQY